MKKTNFYLKLDNTLLTKHKTKLFFTELPEYFDYIFNDDVMLIIPNIFKNITRQIKQNKKLISNLFFVYGPDKSGKSSLLRGGEFYLGLILEILKEAYKYSLKIVTNIDDIIILKLGIVAYQDNKVFNMIQYPNKKKSFFDEVIINTQDNKLLDTIYIKHISTHEEILLEIEKGLKRRDEVIDLDLQFIMCYQYMIEIKNKNLENTLTLQFDFMEVNSGNDKIEYIPNYVEEILLKNILRTTNLLLERFLYRKKDGKLFKEDTYDFINFFLCLEGKRQSNITEDFLKITNKLKKIFARNDLLYSDTNTNCTICHNCRDLKDKIEINKKLQLELIDDLDKISEDLNQVCLTIESNKFHSVIEKSSLKLERIYKNISMDSIKLEKMVQQLQGVFDRAKSNINELKKECEGCKNLARDKSNNKSNIKSKIFSSNKNK